MVCRNPSEAIEEKKEETSLGNVSFERERSTRVVFWITATFGFGIVEIEESLT